LEGDEVRNAFLVLNFLDKTKKKKAESRLIGDFLGHLSYTTGGFESIDAS